MKTFFTTGAIAAASLFASVASAETIVIDFNDLDAGETLSNQYQQYVMFSSLPGRNGFGNAMIFDTNAFTGQDDDLAADLLNLDTNKVEDIGNVAIISEDNDASDPDDNRFGGTFIMNFNQAVTFVGFDAVDINGQESISLELFDGSNTSLGVFSNGTRFGPDNQFFSILANEITGVMRAVITLRGSGAIDNIEFMTAGDPVPVPAALPLFITGVGGLLVARRRRTPA